MIDKYNLTKRENVFLAKKTLVENIYSSAKIEGVNITFPQTKTIIDGMSVSNMDIDDMQKVINLRNAWRYVLSNLEESFRLEYAEKINESVAYNESLEWGVLRNGNVGIYGVNYQPTIPVREEVLKEMGDIFSKETSTTEKAIHYMLYAMRRQLFWDGNKRTALISANKILIENGNGVLIIREDDLEEFNTRLSAFYETNDYSKIDVFLYNRCIFGIDY